MNQYKIFICLCFFYFSIVLSENILRDTDNQHGKIQENIEEGSIVLEDNGSRGKGHILFFHTVGTRSHIHVAKALIEGLLNTGHSVTAGFYHSTNIIHENYTELLIADR